MAMRSVKSIAFVFACCLLGGCETTNTTGQNPAQAVSSDYIHQPTKFSFPKNLGGFHRSRVEKFDPAGKDIGIGYNNPLPIAATIFVYPGPKDVALTPAPKQEGARQSLLTSHFEQCKGDIFRAHPDAKLISEADYTLTQRSESFKGKKAVFSLKYTFGLSSQDSTSELYVFLMEPGVKFLVTDRYFVSYRVTYPVSKQEQASREIAELMWNLAWPIK